MSVYLTCCVALALLAFIFQNFRRYPWLKKR